MEIISTTALISINETFFIQLISFLVFLFILNRVMIRPLRQTMEERDFHFEAIKKDISKADTSYTSIMKEIHAKEATVRKEALSLNKQAEDAGSQEAQEIFKKVTAEIRTLKNQTEADINAMLTAARKQVQNESEKLGIALMEQILDRRLT
jgi:F-type H+-transporting ATPase subunit b